MRQLGVVGLVLLGLSVCAGAIARASSLAWSFSAFADGGAAAVTVLAVNALGIVVLLAFGLWLIRARGRLAERWFDDSKSAVSVSARDLTVVAIVVLGLFIVGGAISATVDAVVQLIVARYDKAQLGIDAVATASMWWQTFGGIVLSPIRLAVGAFLIAFAQRLADRLWSVGTAAPPQGLPAVVRTCPGCGAEYDPADYRVDAEVTRCSSCGCDLGACV